MSEGDMRNILRLMSYNEWVSFERYLSSLENTSLAMLKNSDDEKKLFRGQGALHILNEISRARDIFKQRLNGE